MISLHAQMICAIYCMSPVIAVNLGLFLTSYSVPVSMRKVLNNLLL